VISAAKIQDPETAGAREPFQDFAFDEARAEAVDEAVPVLEVGFLPRRAIQFDGGWHVGPTMYRLSGAAALGRTIAACGSNQGAPAST
jgi:hypothetical protein